MARLSATGEKGGGCKHGPTQAQLMHETSSSPDKTSPMIGVDGLNQGPSVKSRLHNFIRQTRSSEWQYTLRRWIIQLFKLGKRWALSIQAS